jgi:hypothetical protein
MTKITLSVVLTMAFLCFGITDASAGKNANAKWALHFAGTHNPSVNDCSFFVSDCLCEVVVDGPGSAGRYDIYLMALDTDGIGAIRYGLSCEPPSAFYFYGWESCYSLWIPTGSSWPAHGGGVMQGLGYEYDGHVTLGILDVYVAGHLSPRIYMTDDPEVGFAQMCDGTTPSPLCVSRTFASTPAAFGYIGFGAAATSSLPNSQNSSGGYNPCGVISTESRSWGSVKALYR